MNEDLSELTPLAGGWSGETFLAQAAGERSVVRIYARPGDRGEHAAEIDAALLRLVRGLVPVADVLEVRRAVPEADVPAMLVTAFVEGERGDVLLPTLNQAGLATLGRDVGRLVATLAGMPTLESGTFRDGTLAVEPFTLDLSEWVDQHAAAYAHWTADERAGLAEVADTAQDLLDTVGRTCLVHSDFNSKNLIVDPETLTVTALLDWEFAHSGHPCTDLGNVLRFERHPAWVEAVVTAYVDRHGGDPAETVELAHSADMWALVGLAARRGANPVADRAHDLLRAIAARRNVHVTT
ncbi:phosphotransferase [Nocardioides sp. InS609-2]|uniref:phosphotransferase family protein n=1 Tax=Nocardioides sp. InS609-2 TaxID=2760705 RepID=UPI0020BEC10C|nr:phosphotransferase [Nocardioides sp. InS609-2]